MPEGGVRNSANTLAPGIDVRGEDGYIVVAPSLHESGDRYEWEADADLLGFTPAAWPEWATASAKKQSHSPAKAIGDVIPQGERDTVLTSLAGTMRRRGMSEAAIFAALNEENRELCSPPLPEADIRRIAGSIARYSPAADIPVKTGLTTYRRLRKIDTDPPSYVLEVSGVDVDLSLSQLDSPAMLRRAVMAQANMVVSRMKAAEWDNTIAALFAEMEIIPAPDDASEKGVIWEALCSYLRTDATEDPERFHDEERPLETEAHVLIRGVAARNFIRSAGFTIEQHALWRIAQSHGAINPQRWIGGRTTRVWVIPRSALQTEGGPDDD